MSASPAGQTPGQTPNGGPLPPMRRPKKADPMVRPKKRIPKPLPTNGVNGAHPNGVAIPSRGPGQVLPQHPAKPIPQAARPSPPPPPSLALLEGSDRTTSGFSSTALGPVNDYPLMTTKRALMEGLRHHVLRFASKKPVDPTDENQFLRPVRLHRRDPRFNPGEGGDNAEDENEEEKEEREKKEKLKEEREKQKEIDAATIAPSADKPAQRKIPFGKKVQPVYSNNQTEAQKAQSKVKYEETLAWHLEDDENKSTWIGNYEQALSAGFVAIMPGPDGVFRMIPLEKWYRFTPKNKFKPLSIEEAERKMDAKPKRDKWAIKAEQEEKSKRDEAKNRAFTRVYHGKIGTLDRGSGRPNVKTETDQVDDLDFEEDRFADDEETPYMEGALDPEEKETEKKVKQEQLEANIFDLRDEQDYDAEEKKRQREKRMLKQTGKKIKKAIVKRERNYNYEPDDSDQDPYSSSSESEDTETEILKEEERKKEAERKANASDKEKAKLPKVASNASSHGTNTPSGRPSKHPQPLSQATSSKSLKRPGSPNISDASGNESSRKKYMKHNGVAASQPIQPLSRPSSPTLQLPSSSAPDAARPSNSRNPSNLSRHPRSNAGSGSEGEAAGSGGEMSDGTRKQQRLKLKMKSKNGTPQGSRAGSPERGRPPPARTATPVNNADTAEPPITAEELRAAVPPEGLTVKQLMGIFKERIRDAEPKKHFTILLRKNTVYDPKTKLLKLLH